MNARISRIALGLLAGFVTLLSATAAQAQGMGGGDSGGSGLGIAAGLGIALAAFGGALGQGRTAAAALDGMARNPSAAGKLFTPMILCLALIESLVIYSLIISIILVGKIH